MNVFKLFDKSSSSEQCLTQEQTDFLNAFLPPAPVPSAWRGLLFPHPARLLLVNFPCQNLEKENVQIELNTD